MKQREGIFPKYFNNKHNCSTNAAMGLWPIDKALVMVNPCSLADFLAELFEAQISGGLSIIGLK